MIGYSGLELCAIERLYDIVVTGHFREFMLGAGRCDGGLIGDESLLFYREECGVAGWLRTQEGLRSRLQALGRKDILKTRPFVFSIEGEQLYAFVQTELGDTGFVYYYDENENYLKNTNQTFSEYIEGFVRSNPAGSAAVCRGELLVPSSERPSKYFSRRPAEPVPDFLGPAGSESLSSGYDEGELNQIENLYRIKVDGQLMTLLSRVGREGAWWCKGVVKMFSPEYTVREHLLLQSRVSQGLSCIKAGPDFVGAIIVIAVEGDKYFYLKTSSDKSDLVLCYDEGAKAALYTGMTLFEYMSEIMNRYPSRTLFGGCSLLNYGA
jgi:hypothetical protein